MWGVLGPAEIERHASGFINVLVCTFLMPVMERSNPGAAPGPILGFLDHVSLDSGADEQLGAEFHK